MWKERGCESICHLMYWPPLGEPEGGHKTSGIIGSRDTSLISATSWSPQCSGVLIYGPARPMKWGRCGTTLSDDINWNSHLYTHFVTSRWLLFDLWGNNTAQEKDDMRKWTDNRGLNPWLSSSHITAYVPVTGVPNPCPLKTCGFVVRGCRFFFPCCLSRELCCSSEFEQLSTNSQSAHILVVSMCSHTLTLTHSYTHAHTHTHTHTHTHAHTHTPWTLEEGHPSGWCLSAAKQ